MKPKLYIVTGSKFKFEDLSFKLKDFFDCEKKNWDQFEIQGTPEEIINHKLKAAYDMFKCPVLVDDVSVYIEALNGFPGPYMKDFFKVMTPYEMGNKFAGSRIKAVCRLGLCFSQDDIVISQGEFNGVIVPPKDNEHMGREFEIFVKLDGADKIMLDFTYEERSQFSHRGQAMKNLIDILNKKVGK